MIYNMIVKELAKDIGTVGSYTARRTVSVNTRGEVNE